MSIRPPVWTTRLTTPGANAFAILSGFESLTRAFVAAALPIQTQALFGNDESVSTLILLGSVVSLAVALFIPKLSLVIGRARLCFAGLALLALSTVLFMAQIVPAPGAAEPDALEKSVRALCNEQLPAFKRPAVIRILWIVEL